MSSVASKPNSLEAILTRRIARLQTRTYDWDALKFQADYDRKYRRAQLALCRHRRHRGRSRR